MLYITWGKKRVERKQGLVADFCPVCRDVRAFQLIRVGLATHVNHISFGQGKLAGYLIRCQKCGVRLQSDVARYARVEKGRASGIDELTQKTFPNVRTVCGERLAMEARLKSSAAFLSPEQRKLLLLEPFALLNSAVEARFKNSMQFDKPSGMGCLGTIVVGCAIFFASFASTGAMRDNLLVASGVVFGIGAIYTFLRLHLAPMRYVRSQILPALVSALRPLQPAREEVQECIESCKGKKMKIGGVLKLDVVWRDLNR